MANVSWKPIRKIVATALSSITATGLIVAADALGWHLEQGLAAGIVAAIGVLAGYLTPGLATPAVLPASNTPPQEPGA